MALAFVLVSFASFAPAFGRSSSSWPTSVEAQRAHFRPWWLREAFCIHRFEAPDWHERRNANSRGGLQIVWSTWQSVGGSGDPAGWSVREQVYRAWRIWLRDGRSWSEWATAPRCGLR